MFAFISYHCFTMTWLSQRWICRATRPSIPCRFQNLRMCCLNKVSEKNTYIPRFSVSQLVQDFGTSILDRLLHKSAVMPFFLYLFSSSKNDDPGSGICRLPQLWKHWLTRGAMNPDDTCDLDWSLIEGHQSPVIHHVRSFDFKSWCQDSGYCLRRGKSVANNTGWMIEYYNIL